ncbi:MAG: tagatose 1,6-diphosphate aldolase [Chloroflexota bacterium]
MDKVRITKGKYQGITALADERGVIAAAAMDQRGSLRQMIAQARGNGRETTAEDLTQFKTAVTRVLTRHASGVLLDPEYGLPALRVKAPKTGVLLSYEKSGYDPAAKGRLPELLPGWSVRRLVEAGANAIKVLLYYNPFDEERINTIKQAFIERVGAECAAQDVPFFIEFVTYDDAISDVHGLAFARRKPALVTQTMAEFTRSPYRIDVLKVEIPVNLAFVAGTRSCGGTSAYTRQDALRLVREAASVATKPFIYLSGGVTADVFRESLELVAKAGAPFAGVLCGRANWQGGVPAYAQGGSDALVAWLEEEGVKNITALNALLAGSATPWWTVYGGNDHMEIVAPCGS